MERPPARDPVWALVLGGYLFLAAVAFLPLFWGNDTDDFAGWVPVVAVSQVGWALLVGKTRRPTTRIHGRAGVAAAFAALFVFACGLTSLLAPIEVLQLRLDPQNDDPLVIMAVGLALVVLVASLLTAARFARLLAPVAAKGVAAVLFVVAATGLWSLVIGVTSYQLVPQRPWGILDGIVSISAGISGAAALAWSLPLFVHVWILARRPSVDTTEPSP